MDGYDYPMPPPRPETEGEESYLSERMWSDIRPVRTDAVTTWKVYVDPKVTKTIEVEEVEGMPEGWKMVVKGIPYRGAEELFFWFL